MLGNNGDADVSQEMSHVSLDTFSLSENSLSPKSNFPKEWQKVEKPLNVVENVVEKHLKRDHRRGSRNKLCRQWCDEKSRSCNLIMIT